MRKGIALYPWQDCYLENNIFNIPNLYNLFPQGDTSIYEKSNFLKLLKENLSAKGYDFNTIDKVFNDEKFLTETVLFFDAPRKNNKYFSRVIRNSERYRKVLFLWEPEATYPRNYEKKMHNYFDIIFTWDDDLVDGKKYHKFFYPQPSRIINPYLKNYDEKKLCTLIAGNKWSSVFGELYSERKNVILSYEKRPEIDFEFYGREWEKGNNKIKNLLFFYKYRKYKNYCGETNNKLETLSKYKFTICYENQCNKKGYITEKIFDCFFAGTVPVYWGATNIDQYIPRNCYIDRRNFGSNDELYNYITSVSEEEYNSYLDHARAYLDSASFYHFTDQFFIENIVSILNL